MRYVTGFEFRRVQLAMLLNIWWVGIELYRNPIKAFHSAKKMVTRFKKASGGVMIKKGFYVDGKYTWDMFNPAWPSKAYNRFYESHLIECEPIAGRNLYFRRLLIALTKKCPLQCEHCSEWDTLNQNDLLSLQEYEEKIDELVGLGMAQLVYSGGEPINRFDDLISLIERYKEQNDQWIYTSGYQLTLEKAKRLKAAGLNGVAVSLDHHLEAEHNRFRGNTKSFYWVEQSIKHCQEVGLLVSINTCPTKSYIAQKSVDLLIDLAAKWNVPIVNILEPRAVGHYQNEDVELNQQEQQYLEDLSLRINSLQFKTHPTILYPAMLRKHLPCGGGKSYLLLDYDGILRPCPFCKTPIEDLHAVPELCQADR